MKPENDVQEFAYLMNKTGLSYQLIRQYLIAQQAYFSELDDDEDVNNEMMFDFINLHSELTFEQVKEIGKYQLEMLKDEVSIDEECKMVKEMVQSFIPEDFEYMDQDFYLLALDYDIFSKQ